ncbi:MAG: cytochrome C [Helicobacteraceae bacterium CG2_30_36_10]|nr:MAG: cytochrome C [Helicobacteraceae bacterium CG2_30_36_10]
MKIKILMLTVLCSFLNAQELETKQVFEGKEVFQTYCWGCHHQTAVAFGPSFTEIASKRTKEEIVAYIIEPKAMYKAFGYKRTVMTQLKLKEGEIDALSDYILSYKGQ